MKKTKLTIVLALLTSFLFLYPSYMFANEVQSNEWLEETWALKKDRQQEDIPQPEGGTEASERPKRPVSNIILQQRYPETVVLRGPTTENKVALTFDDGPDPRFTPQVLDVLNQHNVKATFFLMGARADKYPELVRRIVEEGHIIGNHTYWHPNLVEEGDIATLETELLRASDTIENLAGYRPKLFRAPYGFLYNELVERVAELNYTIVGWSADSLDWQESPPNVIAYNVLSNTEPGAIILMHDGGEWDADRTVTIEALNIIIPTLKEQGIEFTTVPDLLNIPYQK